MCPILPAKERARYYSRERFTNSRLSVDSAVFNEGRFGLHAIAAIEYILGAAAFPMTPKYWYGDQLVAFQEFERTRNPGRVLDVGCGRGQLEAALMCLDIPFLAIDFSKDAVELTKETCLAWSGISERDEERFQIQNIQLKDLEHGVAKFDTVVFSESIEHILKEEFDRAFMSFQAAHALLIIVNDLELHPIKTDDTGWNHIRRIDDEVYDDIAKHGEVIFRNQSHLVVQL